MAQPRSFKIFCILESERTNAQRIFAVEVKETKTVYHLKEAIREKVQELAKYDAHAIVLYYTSIPGDKNFAENAKTAKQTELAMPMDKLVTVFPTGPQELTVHIIVKPPSESTALPDQHMHVARSPIAKDGVIMDHITKYRPHLIAAITHYLHDDVQLPIWQPQSCSEAVGQHIASLKIPKISASSPSPSLLLHNIGQPSYDEELAKRVDRLFGSGSCQKFLCNTSGSGKTRLLLEGLCRHWGLYITARTQPDGVGSSDLENVLRSLEEFGRLTTITSENSRAAHAANLGVTSRRFYLVLYVRLLVLRTFLECAFSLPGGITEHHRSRWLLIQLAPKTLLKRDVFADLNHALTQISPTYLLSSLQIELDEVRTLLGSQELFCVLDEAQVPTSLFSDCYLSETMPVSSRPILRQLMISWMTFVPNLIVSGTGISMQELETVLGSVVGKEDGALRPETITEVGVFDDEKDQRAYLESYVPPGYLESEVGKEVLPRVGYWLRGRHRFTATYISRLMQAGFESPHTVLNDFVHNMTRFRPSDRPDDSPIRNTLYDLRPFDFSKLQKDEKLLRQVAGCVFDYIFNGKPRDLGGPVNQKLVEYGVARFANNLNVKADEPLALLAATNFFNNETVWNWRSFLVDGVCNANESARGIAFEQLGAYILGLAFSSPRRLSDVFRFVGYNELKDRVAQLVAIHKEGRDSVCSPVDILSAVSTPPYVLGCSPNTAEETLAWIEDPKRTVFCFPHNKMGPDLLLVLMLSDGSVVRVAVQFKQKMESTMGPKQTEEALHTTDPEQFLSQKPRTSTQATPPVNQRHIPNLELSQDLWDALGDLGRGGDNAGKLSLIRVLIPYPATPNAKTLAQLEETDSSHHLVATVDLPSLALQQPEQEMLLSLKLRLEAAAQQRGSKLGKEA